MDLSEISKRKLTIAKELYLHGCSHSIKKSLVDATLSILDFDLCAETLIKAVLVDSNVELKRKGRGFKSFDELVADLKKSYPSIGYVPELESLHKLRNDVQHNSLIPSQSEVDRHLITTRVFFDEICSKVYDDEIRFDEISLALFIQSKVERDILVQMEKALQAGNYVDSVYYAKQAAIYHVRMLRSNMRVPRSLHSPFLLSNTEAIFGDLETFVKDTDERIEWLIDRVCLREYFDEVDDLLGLDRVKIPFFGIKRERASRDNAELTRTVVYDFITGTQSLVKKHDLAEIVIYDFFISEQTADTCTVKLSFTSPAEIAEATLVLTETGTKMPPIVALKITSPSGTYDLPIHDLRKDKSYNITVKVIDKTERRHEWTLPFKKHDFS